MIVRGQLMLCFLIFIANIALAQLNNEEILAAQYYQNGDFEKAASLYQKLFDKSKDPNYYDPYIASLINLKKFDDAEKLARRQLKENPDIAAYMIDVGRVYQERGQVEKATDWYNGIIGKLPKNEALIRDIAVSFYRTEAYDYSIKTFTAGRKVLNSENAFTYDLIALYRFRKDKAMLIYEYLNAMAENPEIINQAENVFSSVFEDNDDYDMLKSSLLRRIQKNPQFLVYTELLTWQFIQQKNFGDALRQTLALDRRLKEDGDRVYELSRLLIENKAYPEAITALNYLTAKGEQSRFYVPAKIDLLNAKNKLIIAGTYTASELVSLEKDYNELIQTFGQNINTAFAVRQLANLKAFYLNKPQEAEVMLEALLEIANLPPSILGQTKLDLGDIYILTGELWEAALIYGQLEKQFANDATGQEAKFRHAKLSYYQADFTWAKAQLDVLKGSTSQLIANDALNLSLLISENLQNESDTAAFKKYAYADLLLYKNQPDKALLTLDSIKAQYPGTTLTDDILMSKAKIYLKQNNYQEALNNLQNIADNYANELWADDAFYLMADIYENKMNNQEKAKQLYQKIITDFPSSMYVIEARKRFRNLRGDKIG